MSEIKKVILERKESGDSGTFGILSVSDFSCYSGELPFRDNHPDTSCIPTGTYTCEWTHSPRLNKETYEVLNVPDRAGIRIHSANYPEQLLGCIALGSTKQVVDGKTGVFNSRETVAKFETLMNKEKFSLEVK